MLVLIWWPHNTPAEREVICAKSPLDDLMFRARGSFCHLTEGQMEGGREGGRWGGSLLVEGRAGRSFGVCFREWGTLTGTEEGQGQRVRRRWDNSLDEIISPVIHSSCKRVQSWTLDSVCVRERKLSVGVIYKVDQLFMQTFLSILCMLLCLKKSHFHWIQVAVQACAVSCILNSGICRPTLSHSVLSSLFTSPLSVTMIHMLFSYFSCPTYLASPVCVSVVFSVGGRARRFWSSVLCLCWWFGMTRFRMWCVCVCVFWGS